MEPISILGLCLLVATLTVAVTLGLHNVSTKPKVTVVKKSVGDVSLLTIEVDSSSVTEAIKNLKRLAKIEFPDLAAQLEPMASIKGTNLRLGEVVMTREDMRKLTPVEYDREEKLIELRGMLREYMLHVVNHTGSDHLTGCQHGYNNMDTSTLLALREFANDLEGDHNGHGS